MPKKILITFLFKEGAGPVFTLEMARGLAQNGCDVYALLSSKVSNRKDWENEKVLKRVIFIETGTRKTAIRATLNFFLRERLVLRKEFRHIAFDYAISTFFHPWATTVLKCATAKKCMVICHDPIPHSGVGRLEKWMTARYIKSATDIIVLTKSFIPIVEHRYGYVTQNIHYMPHGRMSVYKNEKQSRYSAASKDVNFLFFGRIEEYKGLCVLAKAYAKLIKLCPNVSLTIAGSGDFSRYSNMFKNLPKVKIDNRYIDDDEIGSYFDIPNTIVVLPYLDASQSGVVPIALEYCTPIIASDTGGLREQMNDGLFGLFCKAGDDASLMEQMKYITEHPEIILSEKEKMEAYLECLNWDIVTREIIHI